jgi:hypothetical protein
MSPFLLYNGYMDFPFPCRECRSVNLIDFAHLEKSHTTKLSWEYGFHCEKCKKWIAVLVSNQLADDAMQKLAGRKVDRKFPYHFGKTLRRIINLREQAGI